MNKEEKKDLVLNIIEKGIGFLQTTLYAVMNDEDTEISQLPAVEKNERPAADAAGTTARPAADAAGTTARPAADAAGTTARPAADAAGTVLNGIYLVYADGYYELYTGSNDKDGHGGIKYVGVVYDGHSWCVSLKNLGVWPLVSDVEKCPEESGFYRRTECDALIDWEFMMRTKHIQEVGTDIPLEKGEYLPSLPMLVVMCAIKKIINAAITYAGGEPMPDDYHWSVTEYSRSYARNVYFSTGLAYSNLKYNGLVVRPVAAFTFEP